MKRQFQQITTKHGFTLIEVLVSMTLFLGVLVIASQGFNSIITQSTKLSKMEETNIEGVIGLEVMRHDLQQMGFGLPWGWVSWDTTVTEGPQLAISGFKYEESSDGFGKELNDSLNGVPRAFVGYSPMGALKVGSTGPAYISVKGTTAGRSKASQLWTYIPFKTYSTLTGWQSRPITYASNNLSNDDKVIIINSSPNYPNLDRRLVVEPGSSNTVIMSPSFGRDFKNYTSSKYLPTNVNSTYMAYGLGDSTTIPRMPFNRTDFFIGNSNVPSFCAPRTGVLYKATVDHGSAGGYTHIPLLDCVADMQVVLGWDSVERNPLEPADFKDSSVSAYSSLPAAKDGAVSATNNATAIQAWLSDPEKLRNQLKVVKVYILAQEGKRDNSYVSPETTIEVGDQLANGGLTPKITYTLTDEQKKYRWKLYRVVVRPGNLLSNAY